MYVQSVAQLYTADSATPAGFDHGVVEGSSTTPTEFDYVVVGAGPAGSATARWLALRGHSVALIERSRFEEPRIGESLTPAIQPLLVELGVWPDFLALQPLPSYGTRSSWGDVTSQVHSHLSSPWGCGWHVDRRAFDLMLASAACKVGAKPYFGTTVSCVEEHGSGWKFELLRRADDCRASARPELTATVLIDATGRGARIAQRIGAKRFLLDRLVGIATQFDGVDVANEGYVMVETAADGWWYSAPVPDRSLMISLMTDSDLCGRSQLATARAWLAKLAITEGTRTRVGDSHQRWGPRAFSASSQRLRRGQHMGHWLAVGDAALAVDPASGSGVVRALRSARAGAEIAIAQTGTHARDAIEAYEADGDQQCSVYLDERARYYGLEQRWGEHAFWARRGQAGRAM
jgi:flavin-dependent dehydrogenase